MSGDTLLVAAVNHPSSGYGRGQVYVFVRSGNTFVEQAKLVPTSGTGGGQSLYGTSVAIDGDTAVVGWSGQDQLGGDMGAVYVFVRSGTTWSQQAILLPVAETGCCQDFFGASVSISGNTIAVGSTGDDSSTIGNHGSAYIFTRSGTTWTRQAKIFAFDRDWEDNFGRNIAVEGNLLVVAANADNNPGAIDAGSIYIYERSGTTWTLKTKFLNPAMWSESDFFGTALDLHNGAIATLGQYSNALILTNSGSWGVKTELIRGIARLGTIRQDGDRIALATPEAPNGVAIFQRIGASAERRATILPSDVKGTDDYGVAIAFKGNVLAVGAPLSDDGATDSGSVYVFNLQPATALGSIRLAPPCYNPISGSGCQDTIPGFVDSLPGLEFTINWQDFNKHHQVHCGATSTCNRWMRFDAIVAAYSGSLPSGNYDIAKLQRKLSTGNWIDVPNGIMRGEVTPGTPQGVVLSNDMTVAGSQFDTASTANEAIWNHKTTFRLVPLEIPGTGGEVWDIDLQAAQAELVAPPIMIVHGWSSQRQLATYEFPSDLGTTFGAHATSMFGQNPWTWGDPAQVLKSARVDAKKDFRLSGLMLIDEIISTRQHPTTAPGTTYSGPVSIYAHSMGGMMTRYLLEQALPFMNRLEGRPTFVNIPGDHVETELRNTMAAKLTTMRTVPNFGTPSFDASTFINAVTMVDTPHLGSALAGANLDITESWARARYLNPYYVDRQGTTLLDYQLTGEKTYDYGDWATDGAYRDEDVGPSTRPAVIADFELMEIWQGNPMLERLNAGYGTSGVPYFLVAGAWFRIELPNGRESSGDQIVSVASQTRNYDPQSCYKVYQNSNRQDTRSFSVYTTHTTMPHQPIVQKDAIWYFAGQRWNTCDNYPQYPSQASASMLESSTFVGPMMAALSLTNTPEVYEPRVETSVSWNESETSIRVEWEAPGASNGIAVISGMDLELANATVTIRDPTGNIATQGLNTSWATWSAPIDASNNSVMMHFPSATAGTWELYANFTSETQGSLYPYVMFETVESIASYSDTTVLSGENATFRIQLLNGHDAILNATVNLEFRDDQNQTQFLVMSDDGNLPDEAAGDGVYSAQHAFAIHGAHGFKAMTTINGLNLALVGGVYVSDHEIGIHESPPGIPLNVTAQAGPGAGELTVSWEHPTENGFPLEGFHVYRETNGQQDLLQTVGLVNTTLLTGLDNGAHYSLRVSSFNAAGYSDASSVANATTFGPPSEPRNFYVTATAPGELALTWDEPSIGASTVTNYTLERTYGNEVHLINVGANRQFEEFGLANNVTLSYRVRAESGYGSGPFSALVHGTTLVLGPTSPINVTAVAGPGPSQITLHWEPPIDNGGDDVIQYTVHAADNFQSEPIAASATQWTDTNVGTNQSRTYWVVAHNVAGPSQNSSWATATSFALPGTPTNLVIARGPQSANLTWTAPSYTGGTPITGYTVYRAGTTGNMTAIASVAGNSHLDAGLSNGASYTYVVRAENLVGRGNASAPLTASMLHLPNAPRSLTATAEPYAIRLRWTAPTANDGLPIQQFVVYRGTTAGQETRLGTVTTASYTDSEAPPGDLYYYRVAAQSAVGEGPMGNRASARPYAALLGLDPIELPGAPGTMIETRGCRSYTVSTGPASNDCSTSSSAEYSCIQFRAATSAGWYQVTCVPHSALTPEAEALIHTPRRLLTPVEARSAHTIEILYQHEAAQLAPWEGAAGIVPCQPIAINTADVNWLQTNLNQVPLVLRFHEHKATGPDVVTPVVIPGLGQIVAAAEASAGLIPCGL